MSKFTEFVKAAVHHPAIPGVYEVDPHRRGPGYFYYSKWDGKRWLLTARTVERADAQIHTSESMYGKNAAWRGLAQEPK